METNFNNFFANKLFNECLNEKFKTIRESHLISNLNVSLLNEMFAGKWVKITNDGNEILTVKAERFEKTDTYPRVKVYYIYEYYNQIITLSEEKSADLYGSDEIIELKLTETERKFTELDPYGEEDWIVNENINYTDMDPYGEEDWLEDNERMLPRNARCLHNYIEFIEGNIYEVKGGQGDPEGAIEAGYEYMPLKFMKNIDLQVNSRIVTISVEDFILFFEDVN